MKEIAQEVAQQLNLNARLMTFAFQKSGSVMAMQIVSMEVTRKIAPIERALLLNLDAILVVVFLPIGNVTQNQIVLAVKMN